MNVILVLIISVLSHPLFAGSGAELQTFRTHSRISIPIDSQTAAEWKNTKSGFTLKLKGVQASDVNLSDESLALFKDERLESLKVRQLDDGLLLIGEWRFPKGDLAPIDPFMERFEYRESTPAKYVVDFWPKSVPTVGEFKKIKAAQAKRDSIRRAEQAALERKKRREKLEKALAIQEDIGRFCQEPFQDHVDIFLPFYPLHEPLDFSKWLNMRAPDETYPYVIPESNAPDGKYVRIAMNLYQERKYALTIKTIEFFEKEVSNSPFTYDMNFLKANALLKLGHKEAAYRDLERIREKQIGHPTSLFSALYLAHLARVAENHPEMIERYMWISQNHPEHRLNWVFHLVVAEALYAIRQHDRATQEYEWVIANVTEEESKAQASIRLGDGYLSRFQYDRALSAYYQTLQKYPKYAEKSASLKINRAESLYGLNQYDKAEEAFKEFLTQFPSHPAGWRATLRLAEIEGRKTEKNSIAQSRKYFLDTINQYPFSPGATLARMRLIPCGDHAGFTAASADEFYKNEVQVFQSNREMDMKKFNDLKTVMRIKSLILLADYNNALDVSISELDGLDRKSGTYRWIVAIQRQLFRKSILKLLEDGKKFEAIEFYDKRVSKLRLIADPDHEKPDTIMDADYLLRLSQAASQLGLGRLAEKISKTYEEANTVFTLARGIALDTKPNDIDEAILKSEKYYTQAFALWTSGRKENKKSILDLLSKIIDESPRSFLRQVMLGIYAQDDSKFALALQFATSAKMLISQNVYDAQVLDQWIAELKIKIGQNQSGIEIYKRLASSAEIKGNNSELVTMGLKAPFGKEYWLMMAGDLLGKMGRWGEAASSYEGAIDQGLGGNRALYEYAIALEKTSANPKRVLEILEKVSNSKTEDFWKELARKAIASKTAKEGNNP